MLSANVTPVLDSRAPSAAQLSDQSCLSRRRRSVHAEEVVHPRGDDSERCRRHLVRAAAHRVVPAPAIFSSILRVRSRAQPAPIQFRSDKRQQRSSQASMPDTAQSSQAQAGPDRSRQTGRGQTLIPAALPSSGAEHRARVRDPYALLPPCVRIAS